VLGVGVCGVIDLGRSRNAGDIVLRVIRVIRVIRVVGVRATNGVIG